MFIDSQALTTVVFAGGVLTSCPSSLTLPLTWSLADGEVPIPTLPEESIRILSDGSEVPPPPCV